MANTGRIAPLLTLLALACSGAHPPRPDPPLPSKLTPEEAPARGAGAPVGWQASAARQALPEPEPRSVCIVRDRVGRGDAGWELRTRPDAVATMKMRLGEVTAWLAQGRGTSLVEVRSETMWLRGWVPFLETRVLLREPVLAAEGFIPDGDTDRLVTRVVGDQAELQVAFPQAYETILTRPCAELGLLRRQLDVSALLPPEAGKVALRSSGRIETGEGTFELGRFGYWMGAREPDGIQAVRHERATPTAPELISVRVCGGTVFGTVARRHQLGEPRVMWGSNRRCPDTGHHVFVEAALVTPNRVCDAALPLFLASKTFQDHVGQLQPQTPFRLDEQGGGMTRISVPDAPVELMNDAGWMVQAHRIAGCRVLHVPEPEPSPRNPLWPRIRPGPQADAGPGDAP